MATKPRIDLSANGIGSTLGILAFEQLPAGRGGGAMASDGPAKDGRSFSLGEGCHWRPPGAGEVSKPATPIRCRPCRAIRLSLKRLAIDGWDGPRPQIISAGKVQGYAPSQTSAYRSKPL